MKLKDKKGLTLVEMLCTVAILVLVSMVMVLGVQLGVRSYAKSVSYSEAQVLCSTLTTTISDELRYSGTLKVDGSGNVTGFFSQQFGAGAALCGVFGHHIELFHFKGGFGQRVFIFAVFYAQPHCEKGGNIVIR